MKLRKSLSVMAFVMASVLMADEALAQNGDVKAKAASKPAVDMNEMMRKWKEAGTPGENHKFLENFVGRWDTVARMWFEGPAKAPTESKGTAEVKWILDGRFVIEESIGQMMGMPHHGRGTTGYDNFKQKFVASWIDNTATAMYTSEGILDAASKTLTMHGKMDEPMTGERDKAVKYVTRVLSKDKHVFEVYDLAGTPNEFKVVEVTYVRQQ